LVTITGNSFISRPYIADPATVNQNIMVYNFQHIDSYYPHTKSKQKKSQINDNLANAAARSGTPIEGKNRILIVDDEPDIARLFKLGLERQGRFEVDVYNDPIIALSNYRSGIYDLLLLDIKMPEMNGFGLYQNIKERYKEENGEIKVCFITAFEESYKEFQNLFPNLEIDCFIRKPITIDKLVEVVKAKLATVNNNT
jgi:two-component system catabolic regulation response regulator CreB/two-component system response regulator ChvI